MHGCAGRGGCSSSSAFTSLLFGTITGPVRMERAASAAISWSLAIIEAQPRIHELLLRAGELSHADERLREMEIFLDREGAS